MSSLHIDRHEKRWITISMILLAAFAVLIGISGFALGVQVPTLDQKIDPAKLDQDPEWSNPGVREIVPGKRYEVFLIAQTWQFVPREIVVPAGAKVTFYVTSRDIQHGFKVLNTDLNVQVIPGYVGKLSYTFKHPGEYKFICTEYCGLGHAAMFGVIKVVPPEEFGK